MQDNGWGGIKYVETVLSVQLFYKLKKCNTCTWKKNCIYIKENTMNKIALPPPK